MTAPPGSSVKEIACGSEPMRAGRRPAGAAAAATSAAAAREIAGCGPGDLQLLAVVGPDGSARDQPGRRCPQPEAQSLAGVGGRVDQHDARGGREVRRQIGGSADAHRHSHTHRGAVAPNAGEPLVGLEVAHRVVGPGQSGEIVDQQHDRRGDRAGPPGRHLVVKQSQQAGPALAVGRRDDCTHMGETLERRQQPGVQVDRVDVQVVGGEGSAQVEGHCGQSGGFTRSGSAHHHQMAVAGVPSARELALARRVVHQPGRGLAGRDRGREDARGELGGQRRGPRRAGRSAAPAPVGGPHRVQHCVRSLRPAESRPCSQSRRGSQSGRGSWSRRGSERACREGSSADATRRPAERRGVVPVTRADWKAISSPGPRRASA